MRQKALNTHWMSVLCPILLPPHPMAFIFFSQDKELLFPLPYLLWGGGRGGVGLRKDSLLIFPLH